MRSSACSSERKIFFFNTLKQTAEPVIRQSNVEITGRTPACSEPELDARGPPERLQPRWARSRLRLDADKQDERRNFEDESY
jgi:hypothetical protein